VLLGWNDLCMHCSNKIFADLAVLPPFNTFWAVLIERGDAQSDPVVVGPGYRVSYYFENNTWSVGKTDFWSWEDRLFGVHLPDNIGLTGRGLTGDLDWAGDHFVADGTPLTPFDDGQLLHEQPFQLANLVARNAQDQIVAQTQIVTPVSNEMTCSACHDPEDGETVDQDILREHDEEHGTNLMGSRPVLCATCHASNALGMPGNPNLPSLSLAMHERHAEETDDCYLCHPGPHTQCLRDVMSQQYGMVCQDCHGTMLQVARSIELGREPWLEEPRCGSCHGFNYEEEPNTLYRNSNNGHGGLYCPVCHNSPHAILPSREERDNRQMVAVQGHAGTLRDCTVCHGIVPSGPGPHGYVPTAVSGATPVSPEPLQAGPNPFTGRIEVRYVVAGAQPIRLAIHDAGGREVRVLAHNSQTPGAHTLVWDGRDHNGRDVARGVYWVRLDSEGTTSSLRLVKAG